MSSQASRVWMVMGRFRSRASFSCAMKSFALGFARREIVMVIEADFAERHDLRMRCEGAEIVEGLRRELRRVVRMHADRCVDLFVAYRRGGRRSRFRAAVAGSDREHARDAGGGCAIEHGIEIVGETLVVEMAVGIDEHRYFRRAA